MKKLEELGSYVGMMWLAFLPFNTPNVVHIPTDNDLNTVLGRNLFSIANDCSVNPSDLSKMLVKKQLKYFDVPLEHAWKVPVLQELLNTRMNNLYVEGFDDYVITE